MAHTALRHTLTHSTLPTGTHKVADGTAFISLYRWRRMWATSCCTPRLARRASDERRPSTQHPNPNPNPTLTLTLTLALASTLALNLALAFPLTTDPYLTLTLALPLTRARRHQRGAHGRQRAPVTAPHPRGASRRVLGGARHAHTILQAGRKHVCKSSPPQEVLT